jgi:hypothetical protein
MRPHDLIPRPAEARCCAPDDLFLHLSCPLRMGSPGFTARAGERLLSMATWGRGGGPWCLLLLLLGEPPHGLVHADFPRPDYETKDVLQDLNW